MNANSGGKRPPAEGTYLPPTIFQYILKYSKGQQIRLLILTAMAFPFLYMSLDLPKTIVNKAIGGKDFPQTILGFELGQIEYLMVLCFAFLALVFVNGGFKYWINVLKGQMGERMLRRLRYELFARVLRFPLPHFRRMSQGENIAMITAEVEPLGGFIGDSFTLPAFQGGTLLTILFFMFMQDPILGTAAIALYPVQMYLIPKLQRQVNRLGKERVRTVRKLSERIGEAISGVQEIHAHDTSELELADFGDRVGKIYAIRYQIYRKKFFIKFLNNFIAQVTPFFFYSIGGYLVITGDLTFGALVAALAAYKDLSAPWKELLNYYQLKEDAKIKYEQLVLQYQPAGMLEERLQREVPDVVPRIDQPITASNLGFEEEGGIKVIDAVNLTVQPGKHVALIGPSGADRSVLSQLIARLLLPTSGTIRIGDQNLATMPEAVTGRRVAYVGQSAYVFSGTVRDNLLYGLKHRPLRDAEYDEDAKRLRDWHAHEAVEAANTLSDINADWIDYEEAGVAGPDELTDRAIAVLALLMLDRDIYQMGLQGTVDPEARPDVAKGFLDARRLLRERMTADPYLQTLVEHFDPAAYNDNMTVAENLLFGTPIGDAFALDRLGNNDHVHRILDQVGLTERFAEAGLKLASIMVELFQDLPSDHEYFERFSFFDADELDEVEKVVSRVERQGLAEAGAEDRDTLISLTFKIVPERHRIGVVDDAMKERILEARRLFAAELPEQYEDSIAFFDEARYNAAASIQDNILFGKVVYGRQRAQQQIGDLIQEVVQSLGLDRSVMDIGLSAEVGIGGSRLSVGQRQRLAIARCALKRPDVLVLDDSIAALDANTQTQLTANLRQEFTERTVIWVLGRQELAVEFDEVVVMEGGKVVQHGPAAKLSEPGGPLHKPEAAE
ncbi:MAG: ATP-binding cassette domain-containing protein [Acetobacterales bacterium]